MLSVDSGDCFVGKYDVTTNITEARKHLGLCPQHNILIAELTVAEHLQFFAQLKGFSRQGEFSKSDRINFRVITVMSFFNKGSVQNMTTVLSF